MEPTSATEGQLRFFDRKPPAADARQELLKGLTTSPKTVSAKYFYDQKGSELFEAITRLPEYYLTRTEMGLFDAHLGTLAGALGEDVCLVEYGSGSSLKIRKLLETIRPRAYVPVDISREHLQTNAAQLHADFPWLEVYPTCADFTGEFVLPEPVSSMRKVGFFPGSSIGNFEPPAATTFLQNAGRTLGAGSRFIIGVDRKKDVGTLEAAYNDSAGVTAQFNLNMLNHLSELLGSPFREGNFRHQARYNAERGCIQMFLEVLQTHEVVAHDTVIRFAAGEQVHTENSFKYHPEEFLAIAAEAEFAEVDMWTDANDHFALFLLESTRP